LVAYVVGEYDSFLDKQELHSKLEDQLPKAMVPGAIVKLDEMPLTPNDKLDHQALPIPSQ
jgi:hypothetical protein